MNSSDIHVGPTGNTLPVEPSFLYERRTKLNKEKKDEKKKEEKRESSCYRWAFTLFKKHFDIENPEFRLYKLLQPICKEFYFQLEECPRTSELHYQGCFSLIHKERLCTLKNLIGINTMHLERVMNWYASVAYCSKSLTKKGKTYTHKTSFIKTINEKQFYKWQKNLVEKLKLPPDDRKIIWVIDEMGGKGKSALTKWMMMNMNCMAFDTTAGKDVAYALDVDITKVVIFDLPRDVEERVNYGTIERIKNGMIFSGKYESRIKCFNPPHIVVFSNFEPDKSKFSSDRWDITRLTNEKEIDFFI